MTSISPGSVVCIVLALCGMIMELGALEDASAPKNLQPNYSKVCSLLRGMWQWTPRWEAAEGWSVDSPVVQVK